MLKKKSKVLIFSAPSGSGKTTIIRHLLSIKELNLSFSISASSRQKRDNEQHGKDYYFFSNDEFKKKIKNNEFLEWEEVYQDCFYGSLKSEVHRLSAEGKHAVFDVDVKGGINIKKYFKNNALAIFIMPPSVEELEKRLTTRSTDNGDAIKIRIEKALYEISFANEFDEIIINDDLNFALSQAEKTVRNFLNT
jgi:guanylate kinase